MENLTKSLKMKTGRMYSTGMLVSLIGPYGLMKVHSLGSESYSKASVNRS